MKIASIVGTRPNFIKLAALIEEIKKHKIEHVLIHTGQHYDTSMSNLFFDELGLPKPDEHLVSSGDSTLDELLGGGGFHKDLVYLLYGNKESNKKITNILLTTAVNSQKPHINGGLGDGIKVAFIDGNNRFNPYNISKYAVSQKLSPRRVLENIFIARAFTWDQMVELLEHKLSKLEQIKVVLISGITTLFQNYEKQTFEDLLNL